MKKIKAYIGTSVFFGCFDPVYCKWANAFIDECLQGKYKPSISDIASLEIADATEHVKEKYARITNAGPKYAEVSDAVVKLASAYIEHKIFRPTCFLEALHFALASVSTADIFVSCSLKKVFDFDKKLLLNSINIYHGYGVLQIFSPSELGGYSHHIDYNYSNDCISLIRKVRINICKVLKKKDDAAKLLYIRKKAHEVKCLMSARIV